MNFSAITSFETITLFILDPAATSRDKANLLAMLPNELKVPYTPLSPEVIIFLIAIS